MNVYVITTDLAPLLPADSAVSNIVAAYQANRNTRWETLRGVLPYGHNLVGPFLYRLNCEETDMVQEKDWTTAFDRLFPNRHVHNLTVERQRLQAMKKADIAFMWLTDQTIPEMIADAALMYGSGKEVVLATDSVHALRRQPLLLEILRHQATYVTKGGQRQAYEAAMADIATAVAQKFVLLTSKYTGLCRGCGGSYQPNEPIMWSRMDGVFHKDCYDKLQDPANASAAMFSADLVGALREKINQLERENTMLMARVSTLERNSK